MSQDARSEMRNVYYAISADIEHGECFYDEEMLKEFHDNLESLKTLSQKLFDEYQEEVEEDEE